MNRKLSIAVLSISLVAAAPLACARKQAETMDDVAKPPGPKPVSGVTSTKSGVSLDFPAGWAEVPLAGPFTANFRSRDAEIELAASDMQIKDFDLEKALDMVSAKFAREGTVREKTTITFEGRPGYRVVADQKRPTGNRGLVYYVFVQREERRATALLFHTSDDERPGQLAQMEALAATAKFDGSGDKSVGRASD